MKNTGRIIIKREIIKDFNLLIKKNGVVK